MSPTDTLNSANISHATGYMPNLEPAEARSFQYPSLEPNSFEKHKVNFYYVVIGNKVVESSYISNEVRTISSFIEIGEIIFKDSRNESPPELDALHSYYKKKYKKIRSK